MLNSLAKSKILLIKVPDRVMIDLGKVTYRLYVTDNTDDCDGMEGVGGAHTRENQGSRESLLGRLHSSSYQLS